MYRNDEIINPCFPEQQNYLTSVGKGFTLFLMTGEVLAASGALVAIYPNRLNPFVSNRIHNNTYVKSVFFSLSSGEMQISF